MKKTNLIIGAVVVVVVLAGALFFLKGQNNPAKNPAGSATTTKAESSQSGVGSTIKQGLLGLLENASGIKCTVSDQSGNYTVIAKGDRVRIDGIDYASISDPNQKGSKGSMVNDGTYAYIWSGKEGMKFDLKATQQNSSPATNTEEESTDWKSWATDMQNSGAKYDCNPTVATDADFTPPSDVKFQDLAELMKGFQQMQNKVNIPPVPAQ